MSIPLKHDDDLDMELAEAFEVVLMSEVCHFCNKPTRFRHEPTVTYICPACSKAHTVAEIGRQILTPNEKNAKAPVMKGEVMELREQDDDLFRQQAALEKKLFMLRNQRRTLQQKIEKAGLPIKRPADLQLTLYQMRDI